MSCAHVSPAGEQCPRRPTTGSLCCRHKKALPVSPCTFCGAGTRSLALVCSKCHRRKWRLLKKQREMNAYLDALLLPSPSGPDPPPVPSAGAPPAG